MCPESHTIDTPIFYCADHKNSSDPQFKLIPMNWQYLYQQQLYENRELKKELEIVESILKDYLPIVSNPDDQK